MLTEGNKVVDNYCLEELRQIYHNQTEIWSAHHKLSMKKFTFKKLKSKPQPVINQPSNLATSVHSPSQSTKLVNQTNLLKQLNLPFAPKCYKIIKTSNHTYVVFQEFPPLTLQNYLQRHPPNQQQKSRLFQNLATAVLQTHNKDIVILGLNPTNIYVKDNLQVVFGDWTLSQISGINLKITISTKQLASSFIANQVKLQGKSGFWSDIYSLGKIFKLISNNNRLWGKVKPNKNIECLISKMMSTDPLERPTIKQVMDSLSGIQGQLQMSSASSWVFHQQTEQVKWQAKGKQPQKQHKEINLKVPEPLIKSFKSTANLRLSQRQLLLKSHKVQTLRTQRNSIQAAISRNTSSTNKSSVQSNLIKAKSQIKYKINVSCKSHLDIQDQSYNFEQSTKKMNNKRNLCFLLADLSEFVFKTGLNAELSFMLLKYSLLSFKQQFQKWKGQQRSAKQDIQLSVILLQQISMVQNLVKKWKDMLKEEDNSSISFKRQLEHINFINDRFMREKIMQFVKQMVVYCQNYQAQKIFSMRLVDILFKTYLILKTLEEESYEKFWTKASNEDQLLLSSQKYLKQERREVPQKQNSIDNQQKMIIQCFSIAQDNNYNLFLMKQISLANRYSLNIYQNQMLQYNQIKHLSRIAAIYKQKSAFTDIEKEQSRLLQKIHRSKEVNRHFKERQNKRNIQRSNTNLKKRILHHSCTKTLPAVIENSSHEYKTEKGEQHKKKEQNQIQKQNLKIHIALQENKKSLKKYKKEIQKNIDSYINLRDRITKLKTNNNNKIVLSTYQEHKGRESGKRIRHYRKKIKTYPSTSKSKEKESIISLQSKE